MIAQLLAQSASLPANDPIVFFIGQGVLGVVCWMLYREYKDEKTKRETQTNKLLEDIVPLLTRATEALERAAARQKE